MHGFSWTGYVRLRHAIGHAISRPVLWVGLTVLVGIGMLSGTMSVWAQDASVPDAVSEADYYEITSLPIPEDIVLEVGGMASLPDGRLAVSTRRGEVWMIENPIMDGDEAPRYRRFAHGLHEPLGLAYRNGALYTHQRGELTRLRDTNGDGVADRYDAIHVWPLAGNYHEYSYGPMVLPDGDLFVTLNLAWVGKGASLAPWSGWALRVSPEGDVMPIAAGMRSPAGFGTNIEGDIFYAENQGDWVGSGRISHVERGDFLGHPASLTWSDRPESPLVLAPEDVPDTGAPMHEIGERVPNLKLPAVWFPQGIMGISTSDILVDTTSGTFGPFEGQLFVGDQGQSTVMRVFLEKVKGAYQGVVFPFRSGFHSGVLRLSWGSDGSLLVGMTNRGWSSTGEAAYGIDRLTWTGAMPFEMKEIRAQPDGFEITFTQPVDRMAASNPAHYHITGFTYHYHSSYGSEIVGRQSAPITGVQVSGDGRSVRLAVDSLRAGYIHEVRLNNVTSASDVPLLHEVGYYTLNRIPEGEPLAVRRAQAPGAASRNEGASPSASDAEPFASDADAASPVSKYQTEMPAAWQGTVDRTITLGTEPGLQYDRTEIQVEAGARVALVFENTDDVMHNVVFVQPGTVESVAQAALNMGLEGPERDYVPRSDNVLYYTSLLEPGTEETIYFTAPDEPGTYTYVCTFPGHWLSMQGTLRVVE
jgi:azurin/glucose/arabinose dehydrogenase